MNTDILLLGKRIAALTPKQAAELKRYLESGDGLGPAGITANLLPVPGSGGAAVDLEVGEALREYEQEMAENGIPSIIETVKRREALAAEARQRLLGKPKSGNSVDDDVSTYPIYSYGP